MYYAAFDVSLLTIGSISLARTGKPTAIVPLGTITADDGEGNASPVFFHHKPSGFNEFAIISQDLVETPRLTDYATFPYADALETAIRAALTVQGWTSPSSFSVSVDVATGIYTFAYSLAFDYALNSFGGEFLGFTTLTSAAPATSFAGSAVPKFAIAPTMLATSLSTPNFEPSGIASRVVADSGDGYGVARETSPQYRDWVQQFELKAKTFRRSAVAAHPWTLQDLVEHCRTKFAFAVYNGFGVAEAEVFSLRSEGAQWKPERASPANDTHFHMPFQTIVEGTIASYSW